MTFYNVFLGAPGSLSAETTAFHEAVGECNQEEAMARGVLYLPLFTSRKAHDQGTIDSNIRMCRYYLLAVDDTIGLHGNTYDHDWWLARKCCEDPNQPMQEAVALLKKLPEGRPLDPFAEKFRGSLKAEGGPRCFEFADEVEFKAIVRRLLSEWLTTIAPEAQSLERA